MTDDEEYTIIEDESPKENPIKMMMPANLTIGNTDRGVVIALEYGGNQNQTFHLPVVKARELASAIIRASDMADEDKNKRYEVFSLSRLFNPYVQETEEEYRIEDGPKRMPCQFSMKLFCFDGMVFCDLDAKPFIRLNLGFSTDQSRSIGQLIMSKADEVEEIMKRKEGGQ